jgi:hypothetical protein
MMVRLLLAAIQQECGQQQGQVQQQQQKGHTRLVELVAAPVAALAKRLGDALCCVQLLEVVLDVLGPEVAGQVCLAAQQQLQEEGKRGQVSYLAEVLLGGWLGVEEHTAWARDIGPRRVAGL